jgi:hypothetical protein
MHHFLSDACRVCLAGRYGHMPSDKTIGPPPTVVTVRTDNDTHEDAVCLYEVRTVPHCLTHHFLSDMHCCPAGCYGQDPRVAATTTPSARNR